MLDILPANPIYLKGASRGAEHSSGIQLHPIKPTKHNTSTRQHRRKLSLLFGTRLTVNSAS